MNIELIDTFITLCETKSFNRTAVLLNVTQSTVSGRVQALERTFGCRLLDRSRAGTELTPEGLRFEPHARALRLDWTAAGRSVAASTGRQSRIGIQHDLLGDRVADWVRVLQAAVPESYLYVEADYSPQMCADVRSGEKDAAILYTPQPSPDLHFETLGEVRYCMVSTLVDEVDDIQPESYILANYAPAFSTTHADLLPELSGVPVSSGQNAVIRGLLLALGGSAYVLEATAKELARMDAFRRVGDAPVITQPVHAAVHLRNRHRRPYRRILSALGDLLATRPGGA